MKNVFSMTSIMASDLLTVAKQMLIHQNEFLKTGHFFINSPCCYGYICSGSVMHSNHSCGMEVHVNTSHVC